jgi:hypothetical protein
VTSDVQATPNVAFKYREDDVDALKKTILLATWVDDESRREKDVASLLPISLPLPEMSTDGGIAPGSAAQIAHAGLFAAVEARLAPLRAFRAVAVPQNSTGLGLVPPRRSLTVGADTADEAAKAARAWTAPWVPRQGGCQEEASIELLSTAALAEGPLPGDVNQFELPLPIDLPLEPLVPGEDRQSAIRAVLSSALAAATKAAANAYRSTPSQVPSLEPSFFPRSRRPVQPLRPENAGATQDEIGGYFSVGVSGVDGSSSSSAFGGDSAASAAPLPPFIVTKKRPASMMAMQGQSAHLDLMKALFAASQAKRRSTCSAIHSSLAATTAPINVDKPFGARLPTRARSLQLGQSDSDQVTPWPPSNSVNDVSFESAVDKLLPKSCLIDVNAITLCPFPTEEPTSSMSAGMSSNVENKANEDVDVGPAPLLVVTRPAEMLKPSCVDSAQAAEVVEVEVGSKSPPPHTPEELLAGNLQNQLQGGIQASTEASSVSLDPLPKSTRSLFFEELAAESMEDKDVAELDAESREDKIAASAPTSPAGALVSDSDMIEGSCHTIEQERGCFCLLAFEFACKQHSPMSRCSRLFCRMLWIRIHVHAPGQRPPRDPGEARPQLLAFIAIPGRFEEAPGFKHFARSVPRN